MPSVAAKRVARNARKHTPLRVDSGLAWHPRPAYSRTGDFIVIHRLGHLNGATNVRDDLALDYQLLSGFELAYDLLGCVTDTFHGGIVSPV